MFKFRTSAQEKQKKEIERLAFEKSRERMELELAAIKAALCVVDPEGLYRLSIYYKYDGKYFVTTTN